MIADIGSTVTKLSAFSGVRSGTAQSLPRFLGQGVAATTAAQGDVRIGLDEARRDLGSRLGIDTSAAELMATCSAAGGLRMSVHGLTEQMTLRAAREASLGAGAIVVHATAGMMTAGDLATLESAHPNLVLLVGGVDYGDRATVLHNARCLADRGIEPPVIYAGNRAAASDVRQILEAAGVTIECADNVYPRLDELNVEPVRERIQALFSERIVTAPGIETLRREARGRILPTPGAVMRATELLATLLGNVLTIDVGGATTDVHSVIHPASEAIRAGTAPEPRSKRTVEGDLGVFVNARHIAAAVPEATFDLDSLVALPTSGAEIASTLCLARHACRLAVRRHAGRLRLRYDTGRAVETVEGRDLSVVAQIIATGGALTRLPGGEALLRALLAEWSADPYAGRLLPRAQARVLIDRHYIMAAVGVLAELEPEAATALLLASLGVEREAPLHG